MILEHKDHHIYKIGPVTSFGWLKRTVRKPGAYDVWESPEGALLAVRCGDTPVIAVFELPPGSSLTSLVQ